MKQKDQKPYVVVRGDHIVEVHTDTNCFFVPYEFMGDGSIEFGVDSVLAIANKLENYTAENIALIFDIMSKCLMSEKIPHGIIDYDKIDDIVTVKVHFSIPLWKKLFFKLIGRL